MTAAGYPPQDFDMGLCCLLFTDGVGGAEVRFCWYSAEEELVEAARVYLEKYLEENETAEIRFWRAGGNGWRW